MKVIDIPNDVDERLREWGSYFKDRRRYMRCGSAEGNYRRHADDPDPDGWGAVERPVPTKPKERNWVLRAIKTNELILNLPIVQRWCVTYAFAYPGLPKFVVLRCIKKFSGRQLSWSAFLDQVDMGRLRVWSQIR